MTHTSFLGSTQCLMGEVSRYCFFSAWTGVCVGPMTRHSFPDSRLNFHLSTQRSGRLLFRVAFAGRHLCLQAIEVLNASAACPLNDQHQLRGALTRYCFFLCGKTSGSAHFPESLQCYRVQCDRCDQIPSALAPSLDDRDGGFHPAVTPSCDMHFGFLEASFRSFHGEGLDFLVWRILSWTRRALA